MIKCRTVQGVFTLLRGTMHVIPPTHTHTHMLKYIYQSMLSLIPPCCLMWIKCQVLPLSDSSGENEWKSLELFLRLSKSQTLLACLTLQQFNTVFRSDVVILLRFSLYLVFLNDQLRKEKHGRSLSLSCWPLSCVGI